MTLECELMDALEELRAAADASGVELLEALFRAAGLAVAAADAADPGVGEELLAGIANQARRFMQPRSASEAEC